MTGTPLDQPWLTVPQAAKRCQRAKRTILTALGRQELRGHRRAEGCHWRIHVDDLDAWVRGEVADVEVGTITRRAS